MIRFLDGPAAGCLGLLLRRAPLYLRAVIDSDGTIDALDQLDDTPRPGESIVAYRREGEATRVHLLIRGRCGGRPSGWYAMAAYRVVEPQPPESVMRDNDAWRAWATAHDREERSWRPR